MEAGRLSIHIMTMMMRIDCPSGRIGQNGHWHMPCMVKNLANFQSRRGQFTVSNRYECLLIMHMSDELALKRKATLEGHVGEVQPEISKNN